MNAPPAPHRLDARAEDDSGALLTRLGTVVGGGAMAAVLASLPAMLRVAEGSTVGRGLEAWAVLAAVLLPVATGLVGLFRRARVGLRTLAGESATAVIAGVLWWAILEAAFLSVVGTVLRAKTHHHGLAGVTFAMMALVSGLFVALLAVRATKMILRAPRSGQRAALLVVAAFAFLVVILVDLRTAKSETLHTAAALVDVLAVGVGAAVASARRLTRLRLLAFAGVPLALLIVVLGAVFYGGSAVADSAFMSTNAPFHVWIVSLISH